jgi:IS605 OrfB family transposase
MRVIKTFQYRIKDSNAAAHLNQMARSVNVVWNFCGDAQKHAIRWDKRWPSAYDLHNLTAGSTKLLGLQADTVQQVCTEYATRRKQFRKPLLRFRGKRSLGWIPFKRRSIKVKGNSFIYLGRRFPVWLSRPIEGVMKTGSFSQDARGRWYINVQCEVVDAEPSQGTSAVGIDLGLKTLATLSDGREIEYKRFYRDLEPALAVAQRARKKGRAKAINRKIANRRKDFLHKESTRLVNDHAAIFVGNVSSSKLAKTRMAKSVLDAGWSTLKEMIRWKANARGVIFEEIDEAYTTRGCSECGALSGPKGLKDLGVREWTCSECGSAHDRDVNSARLILALGCQRLAEGIPRL